MNKLFTLFTLLLLLPLAARAAGNPTTLTVGGTDVLDGSYWLTNADGTLTADGASADNYNVYYDGDGTLTLKDATINGTDTIGGPQLRAARPGSNRRSPAHPCVWESDHPRRRQPDRAGG